MKNVNLNDFKKGIRYLQKEALKIGQYKTIAHLGWIVPFSLYLSSQCPKKYGGLCTAFWKNTVIANDYWFERIAKCNEMYDICYRDETYLFDWGETDQGLDIWHYALTKDIFKIAGGGIHTPLNEIIGKLEEIYDKMYYTRS